jgi:hypothetical protein
MLSKPWWENRPERLEWEFEWLRFRGFVYNETRRDPNSGTLELEVQYPIDDSSLRYTNNQTGTNDRAAQR